MASKGYPGSYRTGERITGLDEISSENVVAFHAGTRTSNGNVVTAGGRVLAVTAWSDSIRGALRAAYDSVEKIHYEGAFWRSDIGHRAL